MWHKEKIGSFLIFCCKNTTCVVLFMQSTYIISEVLRIGICPDDAFTLDYRMHQSAGYSWSCSYTILKWQLVTSSVRREIWSFWIFCCKNTTYVVLFMRSTYIISEFTHHRLVVAMGGEVKKFEASNNSLHSCLSFLERVQSQNVCCLPVQRPITPPGGGGVQISWNIILMMYWHVCAVLDIQWSQSVILSSCT